MKKALAMKWVKALRSGKYKQAKDYLRVEGENGRESYCCLGVLGTICGIPKDTLSENKTLESFRKKCNIESDEGTPFVEGESTRIKVRIGKGFEEFPTLASANDGGASFKAIATWIEKNYKSL
jgi:hypothetical protein